MRENSANETDQQTNVNSVQVSSTAAYHSSLVLSSCLKAVQGTQCHKHDIQVMTQTSTDCTYTCIY